MRIWATPVHLMCGKHLRGEHVELHMFASVIAKGKSVQGFIDDGLFDINQLASRHEIVAAEMLRRGGNHQSPLDFNAARYPQIETTNHIDVRANTFELARRCPDCCDLISTSPIALPFKRGGDKTFFRDGEWRIMITGEILDIMFTTKPKALFHLERLRRAMTLKRQGRL